MADDQVAPPPAGVLLPCPFCGGEADLTELPPHTHGPLASFMPDHPGSWAVECHACAVGILRYERADAVTTWNRRVLPSDAPLPWEQTPCIRVSPEQREEIERALRNAEPAQLAILRDHPTPQRIMATIQAVVDAQDKTERAKGAAAVLTPMRLLLGLGEPPPSQRGPAPPAAQQGGDHAE